MIKHTQGTWTVHEAGRIGKDGPAPAYIEVRAGEHATVCTLFPHAGVGGAGVPTSRANAHLIAAAPDLLEALKQCKTGAEYQDELGDIIDAAISKAEGPR